MTAFVYSPDSIQTCPTTPRGKTVTPVVRSSYLGCEVPNARLLGWPV